MCAESNKECCKPKIAVDLTAANEILDQYRGKPGALIPALQKVQEHYRWLSQPLVEHIARELNMFLSEVYGVVSFYSQFYTSPRGEYTIQICRGTACHVKGSLRILEQLAAELGVEPGEMTRDGKFTVEEVNCIGACGIAPVIVAGGKTFGSLTVAQALAAIRNFDSGV